MCFYPLVAIANMGTLNETDRGGIIVCQRSFDVGQLMY
jgi:hypothetical protein